MGIIDTIKNLLRGSDDYYRQEDSIKYQFYRRPEDKYHYVESKCDECGITIYHDGKCSYCGKTLCWRCHHPRFHQCRFDSVPSDGDRPGVVIVYQKDEWRADK